MANHFEQRLGGIRKQLIASYDAGKPMSTASRGSERELFVSSFLRNVLPTPFRLGDGEVVDSFGNSSGQLEVVIEYPFMPSIPAIAEGPRLYFAEGVAAAIEVKSDLMSQWDEVKATAAQLRTVRRQAIMVVKHGGMRGDPERIPLFAVGFEGWVKPETAQEKAESGVVDAILVIKSGICASTDGVSTKMSTGEHSLALFLELIHRAVSSVHAIDASLMPYALRGTP